MLIYCLHNKIIWIGAQKYMFYHEKCNEDNTCTRVKVE